MIVRDNQGFIVQHPITESSGGDTARSTGMMALFGSRLDMDLLLKLEKPPGSGLLSRHPKFYSNDCFTRDQMLPVVGALGLSKHPEKKALVKRVFYSHLKRGFFSQNYMKQFAEKDGTRVNKGFFGRDPLSPSHIGHLILSAKIYWAYIFLPFCYLWILLDIFYHAKVNPRAEPNQLIAMLMTYDLMWLWVLLHPNWKRSLELYWCNWRDQKEIYDYIVKGITKELEKDLIF